MESNRKLIEIFEGKMRGKLDEIWGKSDEKVIVNDAPNVEGDDQGIPDTSVFLDNTVTK